MFLAGQVIVKTEHLDQLNAPGRCTQLPDAFARLPVWWCRVLFSLAMGRYKEEEVKLHVFFVLIDILIVLAYPFIFIASKVRKYFNFKG